MKKTKKEYALRWTAALLAAAVMAGCASDVKLDDNVPVESRTPTEQLPAGDAALAGAGAGPGGVASVDLTRRNPAGLAALNALPRVIYFDYDSYVVKDEYRALLDSHAKALTADRNRKLSIQGHTDERGGREYNLALGQRRAEAVARSLALLGVGEAQVEAVSFGKERPAEPGVDEASWAKNRRAELVYR